MPQIDWKVSVGNILTIAGFIIGLFIWGSSVEKSIAANTKDIENDKGNLTRIEEKVDFLIELAITNKKP